jgi:hypothetical protein
MSVHYIIHKHYHQQMHKESFIINRNTLAAAGPRRLHASKNNAVHSQQHILTQQ